MDSKSPSRKIVIRSCDECYSKDHKGAFGQVRYIPTCRKTGKDLPYTTSSSIQRNNAVFINAIYTGAIPDWCPLELNGH